MNHPSGADVQANIGRPSLNPKHFYDRRQFRNELTDREEVYDDNAENDDTVDEYVEDQEFAEKIKLCVICYSAVGTRFEGNEICGFEKQFSCNQNHSLCQCCAEYYATQSEIGCNLSSKKSPHSTTTHSQASTNSLSGKNRNTTKVYERREMKMVNNNKDMTGHCLRRRCGIAEPPHTASYIDSDEVPSNDVNGIKAQLFNHCYQIKNSNESMRWKTRITSDISIEWSRRPIRCPRLDCAVNVAFSALTHHFLFDHPEVPILSVEPGAMSTLIISFASISCESSRCLAVLLVSSTLECIVSRLSNGNQIHPKYRDRLPFPVLAARLHCTNNYTTHDDAKARSESNNNNNNNKGDIIIMWIAGLDITDVGLHCTVQVVDRLEGDRSRSLSYTGPINSLRTARSPREVFLIGDCLILHEGLLKHLTANSTTLNINVIVR